MKKPLTIRVTEAMSNPKLLGPFFAGPSWATWRSVLKATFAEPMSGDECAIFHSVAEREPPKQRVNEAVYIVGRGGGKDSVASLIATCIAVNFNPKGNLRPGEVATIMCIAVDREQAGIVTSYIKAYFETVPALAALVKSIHRDGVTLHNGVVIVVATNSYRSVPGRTIICAIFDEVAFWRSEDSATPDVEVAGAVAPGLARMPGSMLVLISTVHKRSGLLYQRWKDHYGRDNDDTLVVRGSTTTFNPTFNAKIIARQIADDPQLYGAEYNSEWRDDLVSFIDRNAVMACVTPNVYKRPPLFGKHKYFSFVDPSGGSSDSMTCAIGHREGDIVVVDCIREITAPFDPESATDEFVKLFRTYGVTRTNGDRYASAWCSQSFEKRNITYRHSELVTSALYQNLLPYLNSKTIRLLDNARSINQICALERRTFRGAKDSIGHPQGEHDDVANSIAGLCYVVIDRHAPAQAAYGVQTTAYCDDFARANGPPSQNARKPTRLELEARSWSAPCTVDFSKPQTKGH
jgi:hypothetical protein